MLTLTEIFLKSRVGVYKDTPENRRLHRVGQRYGQTKEEQKQKEQDASVARIKAQQKESDRQYGKAEELLHALKNRGLNEFTISRSITSFGVSTYVQGYGLKFRISDHSVTSNYRIMNENFFNYDSDVEKLADYAKRHYDAIQERARKWQEESDRRKAEEKELDDYWESIRDEFDGRVFGENNRTYADPKTFAEKHPEWTDIHATPLGGGAYSYEWAQRSAYGRRKPSYAWLRWHRETHGEVRKSMPRSLIDLYLMKSYKYIRREWVNGRWKYWYDAVSPKERWYKGGFKDIHGSGYWHRIRDAFDTLMKEQRGQVENVFSVRLPFMYMDDATGDWTVAKDTDGSPISQKVGVDLVWGNRRSQLGLEHIIDKHYQQYDHYHALDDIVNAMDDSIKEMNAGAGVNVTTVLTDDMGNKLDVPKYIITTPNGNRMVVGVKKTTDGSGKTAVKHFVLTSFVVDRKWRSKMNDTAEVQDRIEKQRRGKKNPPPVVK